MVIEPISPRCQRLLAADAVPMLGISPFNSYFSEARIAWLARWARSIHSEFRLFIPDAPTVYTLEAQGYAPGKARRKARRQCQYLYNKATRALVTEGLSTTQAASRILCSSDLEQDPAFERIRAAVRERFDTDPRFRAGCRETSRWVLESQSAGNSYDDDAIDHACQYLLAELPLFLRAPEATGVESVAFVYHDCPAFLQRILEVGGDPLLHPGQAFVVVRPRSELKVQVA
jgi:cyclo(L-tyrosyl-L-tyrosyl) synthase